jgi:heme exporter protein C
VYPVFSPRTAPAHRAWRVLAAIAGLGIPLALVLAFTWAPMAVIPLGEGAVQDDWPQKIFYLHVPIAFAAYLGFFAGAWNAVLYLWRGHEAYDVRSYVGVHVGMVFGTLVLLTGSLWARAAWGTWWQWEDRQLLVFLILYLFYGAYFMLRFSLDAGRYRARVSAVFALLGVVLVPLSFLAIRIADTLIHPIVIESDGVNMTAEMGYTFLLASIAFLALCTWMMQLETTGKLRHAELLAAPSAAAPPALDAPAPMGDRAVGSA